MQIFISNSRKWPCKAFSKSLCWRRLETFNLERIRRKISHRASGRILWRIWRQRKSKYFSFFFFGAVNLINFYFLVNVDSRCGSVGFVPRYLRYLFPVILIKCDPTTAEPIRDKRGHCIECEIDEPGLLIGKINQKHPLFQFRGYTNKKESEKKLLHDVFTRGDQFFNSGDVLVGDELGYYYFKDRTGDTYRNVNFFYLRNSKKT